MSNSSNSGDGYLDVVTFVTKRDGTKKPVRIGWARTGQDGKIIGAIEGAVNFSFVIEERRDRPQQGAPAPTSGGGGAGPRRAPVRGDDDGSDIPFIRCEPMAGTGR